MRQAQPVSEVTARMVTLGGMENLTLPHLPPGTETGVIMAPQISK